MMCNTTIIATRRNTQSRIKYRECTEHVPNTFRKRFESNPTQLRHRSEQIRKSYDTEIRQRPEQVQKSDEHVPKQSRKGSLCTVGGRNKFPLTYRFGSVLSVLFFKYSVHCFPPGLPETGVGAPGEQKHQVSSKSASVTPSYLQRTSGGITRCH